MVVRATNSKGHELCPDVGPMDEGQDAELSSANPWVQRWDRRRRLVLNVKNSFETEFLAVLLCPAVHSLTTLSRTRSQTPLLYLLLLWTLIPCHFVTSVPSEPKSRLPH